MRMTSIVHGMRICMALCFWNVGDVLPKSVQNSKMAPRAQSRRVQSMKGSISLKSYNAVSYGLLVEQWLHILL